MGKPRSKGETRWFSHSETLGELMPKGKLAKVSPWRAIAELKTRWRLYTPASTQVRMLMRWPSHTLPWLPSLPCKRDPALYLGSQEYRGRETKPTAERCTIMKHERQYKFNDPPGGMDALKSGLVRGDADIQGNLPWCWPWPRKISVPGSGVMRTTVSLLGPFKGRAFD